MEQHEFTDRYEALGMPHPDPSTMCPGPCEGTGIYPQKLDDPTITSPERQRWQDAHDAPNAHSDGPCDGWHFIKCWRCNGTGKRAD